MLVFPQDWRPSTTPQPPTLFTFCCTTANGDRLFGASLRLYDDTRDAHALKDCLLQEFFDDPASNLYVSTPLRKHFSGTCPTTWMESSKKNELSSVAVSRLVARLRYVANWRDLCPWWSPVSRRRAVRRALIKMIAGLEEKWSGTVEDSIVTAETQKLEDDVFSFLQKSSCLCFSVPRFRGRWRKALVHVCSHRKEEKHRASFGTYRLIEMETEEHTVKTRAIRPCKTVAVALECRAMQRKA